MDIPNNATGNAIREIIRNGVDLTKEMEIDFFIAVPSENAGELISKEISSLGFSISIENDVETNTWTCYCSKKMMLDYNLISEFETKLDSIAKKVGGYIDGFGTYGNL